MVDDARAEDAAERAGVLEERRHQHEQRGVHEERLEALLDREAGDDVDRAREHEHGQRLARDAAQDRLPATGGWRPARRHAAIAHSTATIGVTHASPTR